jgi:outer membrane protein assembly factor BamB
MRPLRWLGTSVAILAGLTVLSAGPDAPRPSAEAVPAPLSRGHNDKAPDLSRSWPMYGGTPARNMANPLARGIVDDFRVKRGEERNVRWSVPLTGQRIGSNAVSVPAVVGSRLFVGTNNRWPRDPNVKGDKGVMLCLCTHNGELLWQIAHDKLAAGAVNDWPQLGIASSPCVDGERVYYVSNRAEVVCADIDGDGSGAGRILWSFDMVGRLGVFPCHLAVCSPLVFGDAVFVVTGNGVVAGALKFPAPHAPAFLALDKRTGKVLWHSNLPGRKVMEGQWGNPSAAVVGGKAQVLFPGGDGWLYSFEPKSGRLLWKFDCNPKKATPYRTGGDEKGFSILSAPVIHEGKAYIAVGQNPDGAAFVGHLWCIDITKKPKNKEKDLSPVNDNFDPKHPVNKDSGLVWHYGGRVAHVPKDDESEYVFGQTLSTVSIHEGLLYALEFGGRLHCLDAMTGRRLWVYDLADGTWNSAYYADGKVFVGTDGGDLYVFRHGRKLSPPRKISVGPSLKSPPVAVNGVLYLNAGTRLYALARP